MIWFPADATDIGTANGAVTYRQGDGRLVSLPWPGPAHREGGVWRPAILARFSDGTALAVWQWADWERQVTEEVLDAVRG